MKHAPRAQGARRYIANVSVAGTSQLHLRNPYVVAFWSAIFPGMGHILLSRYMRGYFLFIWESVINTMAHVNMAIFYSLLGRFEEAKSVIDTRWSLLYIPTFAFAIWDSYRSAVELNKHYILARREAAPFGIFVMKAAGINAVEKTTPVVPSLWCLLTPGLGQFMLHRLVSGFAITFLWIIIIYSSNVLTAINLSFLGHLEMAKSVLNLQWFLNIPSIYFFCAYATFTATVEQNKLFEWEGSQFLKMNYQNADFPFPPE